MIDVICDDVTTIQPFIIIIRHRNIKMSFNFIHIHCFYYCLLLVENCTSISTFGSEVHFLKLKIMLCTVFTVYVQSIRYFSIHTRRKRRICLNLMSSTTITITRTDRPTHKIKFFFLLHQVAWRTTYFYIFCCFTQMFRVHEMEWNARKYIHKMINYLAFINNRERERLIMVFDIFRWACFGFQFSV